MDEIRRLDAIHGIGEETSHTLALRALDLTSALLAALVPGLTAVDSLDELERTWEAGRVPVLAPRHFLDEDDTLPHSWSTTSDAIAARLADTLGTCELILLKSAPLPPGTNRVEAARLGLVDPIFPEASRGLEFVTYINLRNDPLEARPLPR